MISIRLKRPSERRIARDGFPDFRERLWKWPRGLVGKLGRPDDRRQQRRRRKICDRESIANEIAGRLQLLCQPIHCGESLLARDLGRGRGDIHLPPHDHADERRHRALSKLSGRARVRYEQRAHKFRIRQDHVKHPTPDVRPEFLVEVVFDFERAPALIAGRSGRARVLGTCARVPR